MDHILSHQKKFCQVSLKDDTILTSAINQEKHVEKVLKKLVESNSMKEKTRKSLKPVGTRPGAMYGSCKVHKASVENCLLFRPILPVLNTPNYKLTKFLVQLYRLCQKMNSQLKILFIFLKKLLINNMISLWIVWM